MYLNGTYTIESVEQIEIHVYVESLLEEKNVYRIMNLKFCKTLIEKYY